MDSKPAFEAFEFGEVKETVQAIVSRFTSIEYYNSLTGEATVDAQWVDSVREWEKRGYKSSFDPNCSFTDILPM